MRKPISQSLKERVFKEKGTICFCCKVDLKTLPARDRVLDHIKHVFLGGKNSIENLRPSCRSCNSTRAVMTDEELLDYVTNRNNPAYINARRKAKKLYWKEQKKLHSEAARKGWKNRRKTLKDKQTLS